mmetsp:Transcript_3213/g.7922  ORF Transcript_3213/g.7922 Transcript_3213/m.7922 type:complete len:274 (-) Transcript_3213:35-856(-)
MREVHSVSPKPASAFFRLSSRDCVFCQIILRLSALLASSMRHSNEPEMMTRTSVSSVIGASSSHTGHCMTPASITVATCAAAAELASAYVTSRQRRKGFDLLSASMTACGTPSAPTTSSNPFSSSAGFPLKLFTFFISSVLRFSRASSAAFNRCSSSLESASPPSETSPVSSPSAARGATRRERRGASSPTHCSPLSRPRPRPTAPSPTKTLFLVSPLLLFATAAAAAEPPRTPCPGPQRCLLDGLNARHGAVAEPSAAAVMVFAAAAPPVAK